MDAIEMLQNRTREIMKAEDEEERKNEDEGCLMDPFPLRWAKDAL